MPFKRLGNLPLHIPILITTHIYSPQRTPLLIGTKRWDESNNMWFFEKEKTTALFRVIHISSMHLTLLDAKFLWALLH